MNTNFPVPDSKRLQRLIAEAYERAPDPDAVRVKRIGERLARKQPVQHIRIVNKWPWWIILLLAGGVATAAWWAGERWFGEHGPVSKSDELKISDKIMSKKNELPVEEQNTKAEQKAKDKTTFDERKSPVIYQREDF